MKSVTTCLMFVGRQHGKAEQAMQLYTSLFARSEILSILHYRAGEPEQEGTVKSATFSLNGQTFRAMDSGRPHPFTFTPAVSLFVECESLEEIDKAFAILSEDGTVLMPLSTYGFSQRFGWLNDRFGVSWQLNLV